MQAINQYDTLAYHEHASYVSALATPLVDLLAPKARESILDVGCGDGTLAEKIMQSGAHVRGIDLSTEMVDAAKNRGIDVTQMSVTDMPYVDEFDAIFSNATLHWVKAYDSAIEKIYQALKQGGRFVAEFGAEGNIATIIDAMQRVFEANPNYGTFINPWYFPSVKSYQEALEKAGFHVKQIEKIERKTDIDDIENWLKLFANGICAHLDESEQKTFFQEVKAILEKKLYNERNGWHADYVRLRLKAIKPA